MQTMRFPQTKDYYNSHEEKVANYYRGRDSYDFYYSTVFECQSKSIDTDLQILHEIEQQMAFVDNTITAYVYFMTKTQLNK